MLNVFHNMQHLSYKPSGALEATSSNLRQAKVKYFQGAYPQSSVVCMVNSFPSVTKTSCV